jgi:hypothetical protein
MGSMGIEGHAEYEARYTPGRNYSRLIEIYDHARAEYGHSTIVEHARRLSNA